MNINDLEAVRLQSHLSERLHYVRSDNENYMCVNGVAVPYRIGVIILIWAMSGYEPYKATIDPKILELIQQLNPTDVVIQKTSRIIRYLIITFRHYLLKEDEESLSEIIPTDIPSLN